MRGEREAANQNLCSKTEAPNHTAMSETKVPSCYLLSGASQNQLPTIPNNTSKMQKLDVSSESEVSYHIMFLS